jgi:hypothetical protein
MQKKTRSILEELKDVKNSLTMKQGEFQDEEE